jgi:WXG100 family type VII secretion target
VYRSNGEEGRTVSTIGAEMGQLQQLGSSFVRESQTVAQLTAQIGGQVQSTWWKGPAADRFRTSWEGEFAPTLRRLQAALQEASQEINRRHDALLQAGS